MTKLEILQGRVATVGEDNFSITQGKTKRVNCFVSKLEILVADIMPDHPGRMQQREAEAHRRDNFYQALRYLYDTGSSYGQILRAAKKAETEAEHFKEMESATKVAQVSDYRVMDGLASIIVEVKRAWGQNNAMDVVE